VLSLLKKENKSNGERKINTHVNTNLEPNNILFIENLSAEITEPVLRTVFGKYNGFKEVRLFPGKGISFIEFDNEINAGGALLGLNNLHLTNDCILQISFAKK